MATMAENVIASGTENRPLMLEKGMYDSWKTRIWLYIKGKENGEMLLDSIIKGPFQLKEEITVPSADDHVDAYDSDCNDEATASEIFMASLSPAGLLNDDTVAPTYDSDIFSRVPHYDLIMRMIENNVISYADYMVTIENDVAQYVPYPVQDNAMILSVIEQMKSQVEKCNTGQKHNEDLRTKLEYFSEEYDEEIEMEPRPIRNRKTTSVLRMRSPRARRHRKSMVDFKDIPNRDKGGVKRNSKGGRPSGLVIDNNGSQ
nr:integrase, catalytic region, zinc finger, CCHC-type, peptidase aspartic, catalytic [Tanacetum cinerariifolium]